jgi:hypothetical protein
LLAVSIVFLSSCLKDKNSPKTYLISGNASGSQVVPSAPSGASGTISGTYNAGTGVLTYTSTWAGLSGIPSSAGLYSGAVGVNGAAAASPWYLGLSAANSGTVSGTVTLSSIAGAELVAGGLYYSYADTSVSLTGRFADK